MNDLQANALPSDRVVERVGSVPRRTLWRFALVAFFCIGFLQTSGAQENEADDAWRFYVFPVDISGTARDETGKPVAGADVLLLCTHYEAFGKVAQAKTDANGRYQFTEAELLMVRPEPNKRGFDQASFEIVGLADGYGIAWRPQKTFYAITKAEDRNTYVGNHPDPPRRFYSDQTITLDLTFPPPRTIAGRVVNGNGEPIEGVKLDMRFCERIHDRIARGTVKSRSTIEIESMNERDLLPGSLKHRITDADGRFSYEDLPPECFFWFTAYHPDYSAARVWAATTNKDLPKLSGRTHIHIGEVPIVLHSTHEVKLRVVYGDTGKPAAGVYVNPRGGGSSTSNDNGEVNVRLKVGRYDVHLLPAKGTPYLQTDLKDVFSVTGPSEKSLATLKLTPAAVIEATIVDDETGEPIPHADLWIDSRDDRAPEQGASRSELTFRSWDPPIAYVERPVSDDQGKLRVLVPAGLHRIGVGYNRLLDVYRRDVTGVLLDCRASQVHQVVLRVKPAR